MSKLEFKGAPAEIQLKGVYGQVWVSLEPRFATIDSQTSPFVEGGPFICYSGEGVASGDQPNEWISIRKSTIGRIASLESPEEVIPIVKATGELGILRVSVTEQNGSRVSADRWQEWQIEQVRWAAFVEIFKAETRNTVGVTLLKQKLEKLNESIGTVQVVNIDLPNPGLLISELLLQESVPQMRSILVSHFNQLTRFAFEFDHLRMRMASMETHYGWTILSMTSFGAAILSAAVFIGSKGNSLTICPRCSKIFAPKRSNQRFCTPVCRNQFNVKANYRKKKNHKRVEEGENNS